MRHFNERLGEERGIGLTSSGVNLAIQHAG